MRIGTKRCIRSREANHRVTISSEINGCIGARREQEPIDLLKVASVLSPVLSDR